MATIISITCAGLVIILLYVFLRRRLSPVKYTKSLLGGFMVLNGLMVLALTAFLLANTPTLAQETKKGVEQQAEGDVARSGLTNLAAAVAVGLASIGAGIGVALTGSAAIGGITQNPEVFGRSLVFVGLAEGIAIYGLIIAFMMLTR